MGIWKEIKTALNSTVGKGMKPLDRISKEDTSQIIYEISRILSESGVLPSESVLIAPNVPLVPPQFAYHNQNVTNIIVSPEAKVLGFECIYGCNNIKHLYLPHIQKISASSIRANASLTTITFGKALKEIDINGVAFNSDLTHIYYEGTISEWEKIEKAYLVSSEAWDRGCGDYTIVCADGNIEVTGA
jgi:hypothetical protein